MDFGLFLDWSVKMSNLKMSMGQFPDTFYLYKYIFGSFLLLFEGTQYQRRKQGERLGETSDILQTNQLTRKITSRLNNNKQCCNPIDVVNGGNMVNIYTCIISLYISHSRLFKCEKAYYLKVKNNVSLFLPDRYCTSISERGEMLLPVNNGYRGQLLILC